jgi:SAM-dependent methyltransferase
LIMENVRQSYTREYADRIDKKAYPVEFVVRVYLGSYPRLTMDRQSYAGSRILDLGCGDGRNLPLLCDLGFSAHGVEISEDICEVVRKRIAALRLNVVIKMGSNSSIPFSDAFFDHALCCHSLYYVNPDEAFTDNLNELARVVRANGTVVASLPKKYDRYTLRDAQPLGDNHYLVRADPLGLRNGIVFRVFEDAREIESVFGGFFGNFQIGWIENDFFGIEEKLWIVKMTRR